MHQRCGYVINDFRKGNNEPWNVSIKATFEGHSRYPAALCEGPRVTENEKELNTFFKYDETV